MLNYQLVVGFDDVDYARVVYFSRYFEYAEQALADMLRKYIFSQRKLSEEFNIGTPIVYAENHYQAPARLEDTLIIEYQLKNVTTKSFDFCYAIRNKDKNLLLCSGKMCHRFINLENFKGIIINDDLYRSFKNLEVEGSKT